MWFCKNSGQQSIKSSYLHIGVLNCLQLSIVDINWMAGSVFGGISYNVSTIFAKSHEKSHKLWTKNQSLARGLLKLQIEIPLGIYFLGPWEGGIWSRFSFLSLWLHPLASLLPICADSCMNSGPGTNAGPACAQIKGGHLCTFLYQKEKSHGKIKIGFGISEYEGIQITGCFF